MIAEAVTGLEASTLMRVCQLDRLDSALHAPRAGVGDEDFYPGFVEKAAVLVVRIVRTHPLPDGNKRLGWQALTIVALRRLQDLRREHLAPTTRKKAVAPAA